MGNEAEKIEQNVFDQAKTSVQKTFDWNFIFTRAKAVIQNPKGVWGEILNEQDSVRGIYRRYLLALAAFSAFAGFFNQSFYGIGIPFTGMTVRLPFFTGLLSAIFQLGFSLASLYIAAVILEKLAPSFSAQISLLNAFKLVGYSMTPAYLASALLLLPGGFFALLSGVLSLYSVYVYMQGFSAMVSVPAERRVSFFLVSTLAVMLTLIAARAVVGMMFPYPQPKSISLESTEGNGRFLIDLNNLEENSRAFEKALEATRP